MVLVNSNPATIMTDPELADATYIEPLTVELVEKIIDRERPDALLPTVGGQTGLNLAVELAEAGVLERYGVEMIGASLEAVHIAEDRAPLPAGHAGRRPAGAPRRHRGHQRRGRAGLRRGHRLPRARSSLASPSAAPAAASPMTQAALRAAADKGLRA